LLPSVWIFESISVRGGPKIIAFNPAYSLLPHARSTLLDGNFVGWQRVFLVVEDDSTNRALICKALRKEGYQTVEASDGAQALKLLCVGRFDLVITDFVMPKLNGLKLIEELPSIHPRIPIILMTGHLSVTKGKTILDGAAEILPKPFGLAVLRSTIQRLLRDSSGADTGALSGVGAEMLL
jgi:CheY-like chemotaxis protein